ncbi:MAG: hypothetical protein ACD_21C00040G0005 [uncultured bacterium]|nr:MAG: hypothetical protein ACD_21C00040G0005 [uncultured bacterium]
MKNFYDQNKEQFTALVSDEAQALYAARVSFGQLRVLYEAGARPADFKTLRDRNFVINALSSIEAQDLYDAGVTFEQLRVLYEAGAFPKELKGCYGVSTFGENISVGKEQFLAEIKALSSTEAQIAYRKGKALFVDLRLLYDLHRDQFNAITSDDARVLYEVGVSFKQLKILYEVGAPPAELNTMYVADLISNKTKVANEIVALTSDDAQALYKAGAPFKQLKTLYESGVSPADLNTMYAADLISNKTKVANEIAAITSADGQVLYKAGVSFKQLRVLYEANVPFAGLSALYKTDIKKFKALISEEAVKAYKAGESFETLSNRYDPDKGLQPETIRENKGFLQWIMKAQRKIGKNRQQAAQEERRRGL